MGFFSLIIAFVLTRDVLLLISRIVSKISSTHDYDPSRRAFMANSVNYGILGTSTLLTGYGLYEARRQPELQNVTIQLSHLPRNFEGYRIVQFTDLHIGPTIKRNFVDSVVQQINELSPDAIVFTGDLVDGTVDGLKNDAAPLANLQAKDGVFFITGNHEYYSGALPWIDEVSRLGMKPLINDHAVIERGGAQILMAGVTDYTAGNMVPAHASDPHKALINAPEKLVKILLAHQPKSIFEASLAGFDLQLSGHTHGGQYLPWRYMVTLEQPYVVGLHKHNDTWIYINKGTGYWGPPLRLGVPSEITLITLTSNNMVQT
jgi:predicted MPP superfamily phosphohydrolase